MEFVGLQRLSEFFKILFSGDWAPHYYNEERSTQPLHSLQKFLDGATSHHPKDLMDHFYRHEFGKISQGRNAVHCGAGEAVGEWALDIVTQVVAKEVESESVKGALEGKPGCNNPGAGGKNLRVNEWVERFEKLYVWRLLRVVATSPRTREVDSAAAGRVSGIGRKRDQVSLVFMFLMWRDNKAEALLSVISRPVLGSYLVSYMSGGHLPSFFHRW